MEMQDSATAPAQTDDFISSTDGGKSLGKSSLSGPLLASDERSKTGSFADPDTSVALQRIAELEAALEDAKQGGADSLLEAEEAARRLEEVGMDAVVKNFRQVMTDLHEKREFVKCVCVGGGVPFPFYL